MPDSRFYEIVEEESHPSSDLESPENEKLFS